MSRTYRLRHLPRLSGSARKYGDGSYFHSNHERIRRLHIEHFGYDTHDWRLCHDKGLPWYYSRELRAESDALEEANPPPIARSLCHPWVGYHSAAGFRCKVEYRKAGFRAMRRHTRRLCREHVRDFDFADDAIWPLKIEYIDMWDVL